MTKSINTKTTFLKKLLIAILILLGLIYILARIFGPNYIDKSFNRVLHSAPYKASDKALELYQSLDFISDLHSDVLLWKRDITQQHDYGHEDIPRMLSANMALQAFTIVNKVPKGLNFEKNDDKSDQLIGPLIIQGRPLNNLFNLTQRVVTQAQELQEFAERSNGSLRVIKSQRDLKQYLKDRQSNRHIMAGFLGIEGAQALQGDMTNLDIVTNAGIRMIGLTHFFDNEVGGSAHGVNKSGLTPFGRELIHAMEAKSIFVDISHASPTLIDDVLQIATRPILVSHTGVKGTCDNVRNLSDEHLKAIAKTGGVVGIAMFEQAVCGTDAASIAKAIQYTIDLIGAEHVGLGSDFDGAIAAIFDVTGLPLIVDELLKLGVSEADIRLVMGENVKRVLLANLPE